jgi:hypothetical protein
VVYPPYHNWSSTFQNQYFTLSISPETLRCYSSSGHFLIKNCSVLNITRILEVENIDPSCLTVSGLTDSDEVDIYGEPSRGQMKSISYITVLPPDRSSVTISLRYRCYPLRRSRQHGAFSRVSFNVPHVEYAISAPLRTTPDSREMIHTVAIFWLRTRLSYEEGAALLMPY